MNFFITAVTLLIAICAVSSINAKFSSQAVAKDRLMRDLFTDYDVNARPAPNGEKTVLKISLKIYHFDFDERDGSFDFSAHLKVEWQDPKIKWSPSDYNNISLIHIQNAIWVPDLELYNNVASKFLIMHANGYTWVYDTGRVLWADKVKLKVFCAISLRHWPYDRHTCKLLLGSWTHHGFQIDLESADVDVPVEFDEATDNLEFQITNFSVSRIETNYSCCEEPYITLNYDLDFHRRTSAIAVIFHLPAICVAILTLSVFCLEPNRGEKILLNGISILIILFNLVYFARNIASFPSAIPLLVIFYSMCFVLVTISMIISCLVLAASRSKYKSRLPFGLAKVLKSRLGEIFGPVPFFKRRPEQTEMHHQFTNVKLHEHEHLLREDRSPDDWTRVAIVFERLAFVVYSVIFLLLGASLML